MSLDDPLRRWQARSSKERTLARVSGTQAYASDHVSCRVSGHALGDEVAYLSAGDPYSKLVFKTSLMPLDLPLSALLSLTRRSATRAGL
jgi:hypothetical protein